VADIEWVGVPEFTAALQRVGVAARAAARAGVVEAAAEIERQAKMNASGRPGPDVVTGTLRRSISTTAIKPWGLMGWEAGIGPTVIYGRRIELGFHGADSRGRHFDQPGYPYMRPAFQSVGPRVREIWRRNMQAALSSA
jgi:hypothetical protein